MNRLAQGARRQAQPVAKAHGGVHHHNLQVLGQGRVLEPVVQQDNRCAGIHCRPRACQAVARNPGAGKCRQQQRFVPDTRCLVPCGVNFQRSGLGPAITTAHDVRLVESVAQPFSQRDDRRRLARAPRRQVADTDHWHANVGMRPACQPPRRCARVDRAKRLQAARPQAGGIGLPKARCAHQVRSSAR